MNFRSDALAYAVLSLVITLTFIPVFTSGGRLNFNDDFFQYAARHESVRKALLEYHTFPQRAYWFGGGYPTLGDPEDPTLNPLVLLSLAFGTVWGLKLIPYLALLAGTLSAYAFARRILGYTAWGAFFAALTFGTSLFVPFRIQDGNPNEVYAALLPLCLLLIGRACRGRLLALLVLPLLFYTMLSDGKLTFFMAVFYMGVLVLLELVPAFRTLAPATPARRSNFRPLLILLIALGMTALVGMVRILPALELIQNKGGLAHMDLYFHPHEYRPEGVYAYTFDQLWRELIGWKGAQGLVTVGWLPVLLFGVALCTAWKRTLPWGIALVVFAWFLLAYNAPLDLLKLSWKLPIFQALYRPYKYFSFQIAFTVAMAAGQCFSLLTRLRPRWLEPLIALLLIGVGSGFLIPKMMRVHRTTYTYEMPSEALTPAEEFFNVQGRDLPRGRKEPLRAVTYFNLLRGIGTIDWHTGIPIAENAVPRYFVDAKNRLLPNPQYRGEAYFLPAEPALPPVVQSTFHPNSIQLRVEASTPGVLVINQNFHRDWHTDKGRLFNKDGLLALRLEEAGAYTIRLRYRSRSFDAGLVISLLALTVLAATWTYRKRYKSV